MLRYKNLCSGDKLLHNMYNAELNVFMRRAVEIIFPTHLNSF